MFLPHLILLATNIFICQPKGENRDKSISEPSGECKMRRATASAKAHCFRRLSYFPGPLLLLQFHIFKLAIFSFFQRLSTNIFMKIGGKFNWKIWVGTNHEIPNQNTLTRVKIERGITIELPWITWLSRMKTFFHPVAFPLLMWVWLSSNFQCLHFLSINCENYLLTKLFLAEIV